MPLFSSTRERWLWLWALAVVAAIFASLWVGGQLAEALRDHELLDEVLRAGLFLLGLVLLGATTVVMGVWSRPGGVGIAVAMGIAAVYLLVFLRIGVLEERSHLIEYGVLGVFVYAALAERALQGRRVPMPPVLAIAGTSAVGLLDECLQLFVPDRVFDPWDILFNVLAASLAVGASVALGWARRRGRGT
ncbi:MAG: VanZ family protein [Chloroflexi bacterium]|nr:VanZ family protein [Chloroflexota bacterium]